MEQKDDMKMITQHICLTRDVGGHNNLFGGVMMSWLDEAAAILALQTARTNSMVTVAADKIHFIQPVKVGDVVQIMGQVKNIGTTSITIFLHAQSLDPETQTARVVCETEFVFVNLDKWGNKAPIKR